MATIKFGGGIAAMSGSIGGTTFARNKGGAYARQWTKPVNPRAPLQMARRARIAYLTRYWSSDLTEQERIDWRAYATGTTWTNKLGETITINGLAAFLRLNALMGLWATGVNDAAPTAMGHAGGVTITFAAESDTTKLQIDEPTGAFDKTEPLHSLLIFSGLPVEPGRLATPKGFKFVDRIHGDDPVPPAFPYELTAPYTMRAGQIITIRAMFIDEFQRCSGPFWATDTAEPA